MALNVGMNVFASVDDIGWALAMLVATLPVVAAPAQDTAAPPSSSAVVTARVYDALKDQPVVGIDVGTRAGVAVDDTFFLIEDNEVVGRGRIFLVTDDKCSGRLDTTFTPSTETAAARRYEPSPSTAPASASAPARLDQRVAILRRAAMPELCKRLPPGATVVGKLLDVAPDHMSASISITAASGVRPGDQMLISRLGIPISRGKIRHIDRDRAVTGLEPLVSNALPEPGDRVELWPAPADAQWGRLNSTVLAVRPKPPGSIEGDEIILPGTAADGLEVERLIDLYRGRRYVGLAKITALATPRSPLCKANTIEVACTTRPAEGDRAVVRASPYGPPGPITAAVFRIAGDYCLLAAGELDGIRQGERFLVRRQDDIDPTIFHDVAMLTVRKLEPVHCGAAVETLTSEVEGLRLWDLAERQLPGGEQWRTVGIVEAVDAASRTAVASVEPGCAGEAGDVIRWTPEKHEEPGGAVVIHRDTDHMTLLVPPGWGDVAHLARARVDARHTAAAAPG